MRWTECYRLEGKAQKAFAGRFGNAAHIIAGVLDGVAERIFINLLFCHNHSFFFAMGRRNFFYFHGFPNCVIHVTFAHTSGHAGNFYCIFEHSTNNLSYLVRSREDFMLALANSNSNTKFPKRQGKDRIK